MTFAPDSIHRILVRANNWIGDVVMISPSLKALRETWPEARIEIVARPHVAGCFQSHPWVDDVIVHEPRGRHKGPLGFWRLTSELKQRRYDLAVLFQKAFGAALMAKMAGARRIVGYDTDLRASLLTHAIHETPADRAIHHVEYFMRVARESGCNPGEIPRRVYFHFDEENRRFADAFLAARGASRFAFLAAFATGASKPGRAWHAERFAQLAAHLVKERGAGILVLGGPGDRADADRILAEVGDAGIDAVGATTVRQMAALIERCRVFVGNDSGPMHVAAALDVPVLAIFGPGTPAKTAPYMPSDRFIALTNSFPCSPCRQDFFKECDPSPALKPMCLETVTVRQATVALSALLERSSVV